MAHPKETAAWHCMGQGGERRGKPMPLKALERKKKEQRICVVTSACEKMREKKKNNKKNKGVMHILLFSTNKRSSAKKTNKRSNFTKVFRELVKLESGKVVSLKKLYLKLF